MKRMRSGFHLYTWWAILYCFSPALLNGQTIIHGIVSEKTSGEYLVSASIYDTLSGTGTVSNEFGFYSLRLANPDAVLCYSFVGYDPVYIRPGDRDTVINVGLSPNNTLDEVIVVARDQRDELSSSTMSSHDISRMQMSKIPILLGETDMVKALQYLPGVSSGTEGTSGIYVRGGGVDQNLILLDGVPVYNVNHLFGFFSVFNGEAVNSATMYKGGFPARYSGRLSSVIDVGLKEGNMQEFHGSASVGLISSSLMLEGPIIKDKTSFMISGRRTYADLVSYPVQYLINKTNYDNDYLGYFFHDLNAKINHKFSDRSRLFLSTYLGKDEYYMSSSYLSIWTDTTEVKRREGFRWGNMSASLRWNYIWNSRLFSNTMVYWSKYRFTLFNQYEREMDYSELGDSISGGLSSGLHTSLDESYSGIKDLSVLSNFTWSPGNKHQVRFGLKGSSLFFEPSVYLQTWKLDGIGVGSMSAGADTVFAKSLTAYMEDDFQLGERVQVNAGLSSTLFQVDGRTYSSLEPRLAMSCLLSDKFALKASYAKMTQYVHLLSNSVIGLPTDIWVPTTASIVPETSWQVAAGLHYHDSRGWKASVEIFYKEMSNLIEYSEGKELLLFDTDWENQVETGEGLAYGAEFQLEKTQGRLTGSLAYTLSRNTRTFDNLNYGQPFLYKYDKPHDLSLLLNYEFSDRVSLGAVWVLSSGVRTTIRDQVYINPLMQINGTTGSSYMLENFDVRNNYIYEFYHRLDLGISFKKDKQNHIRTWSFGVYNAYMHKNPFYIYTSGGYYDGSSTYENRVYSASLFPFIPYFKYSISF